MRSPDRAPSPTCPFIKNQQCQRAADSKSGQRLVPRFTPGDRLSEFRGDRALRWRWKPSAPRRWSPSMRASGFGQRLFAILFHKVVIQQKINELESRIRAPNSHPARIRMRISFENRLNHPQSDPESACRSPSGPVVNRPFARTRRYRAPRQPIHTQALQ